MNNSSRLTIEDQNQKIKTPKQSTKLTIEEAKTEAKTETLTSKQIEQKNNFIAELQHKLQLCMEENRKLKVAAAKYNWDLEQGQSLETITDAREFFFPKSGPFILNDKLERIEDSITEYKHHPIIYVNMVMKNIHLIAFKVLHYLQQKSIRKKYSSIFEYNGGRLFFGMEMV